MKQTVVVFGSSTGTTEAVAARIAAALGTENVINVTDLTADVIAANDNLILGSSTWGSGELQDDWYDGVKVLKGADLTGKTIALFGCGDSESYCDTFCDAMAEIKAAADGKGALFVGEVDSANYSYDDSQSVVDGKFIGLALDEVNEDSKTDGRIQAWVQQIKPLL